MLGFDPGGFVEIVDHQPVGARHGTVRAIAGPVDAPSCGAVAKVKTGNRIARCAGSCSGFGEIPRCHGLDLRLQTRGLVLVGQPGTQVQFRRKFRSFRIIAA